MKKLKEVSEQSYSPSVPWSLDKHLRNPEVKAAYDALEPEFALIRQLIELRIKLGLSQRQLAKRAKMQQPTIARLEGGQTASLRTLRRVADALDADVQVSLVPRKSGGSAVAKMGDKPTARGGKRSRQK